MATSSSKQIINPTQPNHSSMFRPLPNPCSNPRPRGRRSGAGAGAAGGGNSKSKNDNKDKPRRRGVGMAELERLRRLHDHSSSSPPPPPPSSNNSADFRVNPLPGVPLIHYCIPGQPLPDPRLTLRVAGMPQSSSSSYSELPSIPNSFQLDHSSQFSFKKKKVIGEELSVGFAKGYNGHLSGYDLNNYNGDNNNNHYLATGNGGFTDPTTGSEIVAIHKKWNGSGNMMEYGFFPKKSEKSDNYSPSSSSSSLSSLTTATTTTTTTSFIDLSLKLSSYY